ncbi:MAG: deoxynucleoside kinase [Thermodesulfobacteriota bacterium]
MDQSRYIVVEGPIGAGKTALARKLADSLGARAVLEEIGANPFLAGFQKDRERFAFQTQLFFLLSRFRQQQQLSQLDLFHQGMVADYLFDKDRIFALLHLSEAEFSLYDQVFQLLQGRVPRPDLVIYLSFRSEVLWRKLKSRREEGAWLNLDYLRDLGEAYNHFFFHYNLSPLLVVNAPDPDLFENEDNFRHLLREINSLRKGVKHYVPLGTAESGTKRES